MLNAALARADAALHGGADVAKGGLPLYPVLPLKADMVYASPGTGLATRLAEQAYGATAVRPRKPVPAARPTVLPPRGRSAGPHRRPPTSTSRPRVSSANASGVRQPPRQLDSATLSLMPISAPGTPR